MFVGSFKLVVIECLLRIIQLWNKCRRWRRGKAPLCGASAEYCFVCFEESGEVPGRRVETQGYGCRVLVSRIECVAQVHKKFFAAPAEAILNERIQETRTVEEVRGRDTDRVAGPCEEVLVPGRYVEDLSGDVSKKRGNLGHSDLLSLACGGVMIHCCGMFTGRTQVPRTADDVQTGLCGAHPVVAGPASVSEGLTVVIVFLFIKA